MSVLLSFHPESKTLRHAQKSTDNPRQAKPDQDKARKAQTNSMQFAVFWGLLQLPERSNLSKWWSF
jgi:hypothetical protein